MFTILNRFPRGMYSIGAKFNGVFLGLLTYFVFHDVYVAIAIAFGYVLGESFGWGEWIGTLTSDRITYIDNEEGKNNGIKYIASKFYNPNLDWREYCSVAMVLRGLYWWIPTLVPLYFAGVDERFLLVAITFLAICFPLACEMGYYTSKVWNFKHMSGGWEHQEVWYGLMQDIVFIGLFLTYL